MTDPIVNADLTLRVDREIELLLAYFPWLPEPGVRSAHGSGAAHHVYDEATASHYFLVFDGWQPLDSQLRQLMFHEGGHLWDLAVRARTGRDVAADLGVPDNIPPTDSTMGNTQKEIVAEIFARVLGVEPSRPTLEPYSKPTDARKQYVWTSGKMPDRLEESVILSRKIAEFWDRSDIPPWFRDWAPNFQTWVNLNLVDPLRRIG